MKKLLIASACFLFFILGNFAVIVTMRFLCPLLGYSGKRGAIWEKPVLTTLLLFTGFILVCIGTWWVNRFLKRRLTGSEM